uniref:DM domain-containing protein n=1 Tax=Bursaphelenchus xylophilus TaxID=6326 RepID=A0A1I7SH36_BURXY
MPKEQYMCQLCANHGLFNQPKKGHKQKCPFKECPCNMCALNLKRRALDQIERQLRLFTNEEQTNETISETKETQERTVCEACALQAPP